MLGFRCKSCCGLLRCKANLTRSGKKKAAAGVIPAAASFNWLGCLNSPAIRLGLPDPQTLQLTTLGS